MTESEWNQCDEFPRLFRAMRGIDHSIYCQISLKLVELVPAPLTELESQSIDFIREVRPDNLDSDRALEFRTQLQATLPAGYQSAPASVIGWALEACAGGTNSPKQATSLAAINVVELNLATPVEVCDIVRSIVAWSDTDNVERSKNAVDRATLHS